MSNAEKFIEKYKELESVISNKYNLSKNDSPILYIEHLKEYANYQKELSYCREVRNFLQHESKIENEFAVIPSNEMIDLIEKMIKLVSSSPRCIDIAIPFEKMFCKTLYDFVLDSMKELSHKLYTHIPIINNGRVVGVFSKSSIFNFILDNDLEKINPEMRFIDIKEYIGINYINNEETLFVQKTVPVGEVVEQIQYGFKRGKRITMIFITENGNCNDVVLGMMTPWSLLKTN